MQRPSSLLVLVAAVLVTSSSKESCCNSFTIPQPYPNKGTSLPHASSSFLTQLSSTTADAAATGSSTTIVNQHSSSLEPPINMQELLTLHHNKNSDNETPELSKAQELYNSVVQTTYGYVVVVVIFWKPILSCSSECFISFLSFYHKHTYYKKACCLFWTYRSIFYAHS